MDIRVEEGDKGRWKFLISVSAFVLVRTVRETQTSRGSRKGAFILASGDSEGVQHERKVK